MKSIAKVPTDWLKAGSQPDHYDVGIDYEKEPYGKVSAYIKSVVNALLVLERLCKCAVQMYTKASEYECLHVLK